MSSSTCLRRIIEQNSGQNLAKCQACLDCDFSLRDESDIPLGSIIQLILLNDEQALQSRTIWSDTVYRAAHCKLGLNLQKIILALREEANQRGM